MRPSLFHARFLYFLRRSGWFKNVRATRSRRDSSVTRHATATVSQPLESRTLLSATTDGPFAIAFPYAVANESPNGGVNLQTTVGATTSEVTKALAGDASNVDAGEVYRVFGRGRSGNGNGTQYNPAARQLVGLRAYDSAGAFVDNYFPGEPIHIGQTWEDHTFTFSTDSTAGADITLPSNVASVRPYTIVNAEVATGENRITWRSFHVARESGAFAVGDQVTLSLSGVFNPSNYSWRQLAGPDVTGQSTFVVSDDRPSFVVPSTVRAIAL